MLNKDVLHLRGRRARCGRYTTRKAWKSYIDNEKPPEIGIRCLIQNASPLPKYPAAVYIRRLGSGMRKQLLGWRIDCPALSSSIIRMRMNCPASRGNYPSYFHRRPHLKCKDFRRRRRQGTRTLSRLTRSFHELELTWTAENKQS